LLYAVALIQPTEETAFVNNDTPTAFEDSAGFFKAVAGELALAAVAFVGAMDQVPDSGLAECGVAFGELLN